MIASGEPLRLVVLGATGFVGSAIVRAIDAGGGAIEARALVRGSAERLAASRVVGVGGEMFDVPRDLFPKQPFVLVHFATKQIDHDGRGFERINVDGTRRVLGMLGDACRGVVYGSSASVYGQGAQEGHDEDAARRPETALAQSRAQAEDVVLDSARSRGIDAFVLRPRFILGRGDRSTLPGIARLFARGVSFGPGTQGFTIIDVDDYARVVLALARAITSGSAAPARQIALNVGYESPVTLDDMHDAIGRAVPVPPVRLRIPVTRRFTRALAKAPLRALRAASTKLELIGLPHHVNVRRLAREVGAPLVERDPLVVLRQAAAELRTPLEGASS